MPVAGCFNPTLNDTALGYLALGWSVIPLYGDTHPDRPKVAALPWEAFQRRRARETEVAAWFERPDVGALGLVTGAVSQLVILDFDEPEFVRAFERACPELVATRTVLTRRGQHLYFHVPPQLAIRSRKLDGIDLLAGGRYAVAPPSVIDGHPYTVGRGGQPKTLTQRDLDRLDAFLENTRSEPLQRPAELLVAAAPVKTQAGAAAPDFKPVSETQPPVETPQHASFTSETLVLLYRGLAYQTKRNVALFKASCLARDHGWSYAAVVECLAEVHTAQPARGQHRAEQETSRYREAIATIRSVYTRPPRRLKQPEVGGLYNSIRERLFQLGQTCVVRVLEGLRLAGYRAGQRVTERELLTVLRSLVGRHSIRRALTALTPKGQSIFRRKAPRYPPNCAAATELRIVNTPNADVSVTESDRSKRIPDRPPRGFVIPGLERLCHLLGVAPSGSDPITLDDLRSARQTRMAAHRELIRRRPGLYLRGWLGDRLGVSYVTLCRYNRATDGLQVTPTFTATAIGWWNLNSVPARLGDTSGTYLEDDSGQRWPALKAIAARLLGQRKKVRLLAQSLNHYRFGLVNARQTDRSPETESHAGEPPTITLGQGVERLMRRRSPITTWPMDAPVLVGAGNNSSFTQSSTAGFSPVDYEKPARKRRPRYWQPLKRPEAEALAQRVYRVVNERTTDPGQKLSLATARRQVDQAGEEAVRKALWLLDKRKNVVKPAGWLATILRSRTGKA